METITVILKVIGALFCCFLVFAAGIIIWWYILEIGFRRIRYEQEYIFIDGLLKDEKTLINAENYDLIHGKIIELKRFKCRDKKRNSDLSLRFFWKFKEECTRRCLERTIAKQRAKGTCKQYSKFEL